MAVAERDLARVESISYDRETTAAINLAYQRLQWCNNSIDRQDSTKRWSDAQRFWLGKQWDGIKSFNVPARSADRKKLKPCPVDNYFKAQVEGLVGDVCDAPADIMLRPTEPGDEAIVDYMSNACAHVRNINSFDRKLEFIVRRGILYGPLIGKVYWDNSWKGGRTIPFVGEVKFIGISPESIFIDPRIKGTEPDVLQQANFIIYAVKRSPYQLKTNYPWVTKPITPDAYSAFVEVLGGSPSSTSTYDDDSEVLTLEYWYKGQPLIPDFPENPDRQPFTDASGDGVHCMTIASGVLLQHVSYYAPKYPFALDWMYPSDESIYGYGDAHDMLMPQLMVNKLNELAMEGHSVSTVGNWLYNDGAIRKPVDFQKYAGMGATALPVSDINGIRRELGGGVPGSIFTQYGQEQRAMEIVSGRVDISQGRSPRGIRAASAISLLLQQAAGRIRQRSRAVSSFCKQVTELMLAFVGQYYTDERLLRTVGDDGTVNWTTFNRESILRVIDYTDPITGIQMREEYVPELDVVVSVGAETPTSKAYYAELSMELFTAGVIDEIALLTTLDYPRWREILRRKAGQQQQQQQQPQPQQQGQQSQQQAGGGEQQSMANQQQAEQLLQAFFNGQISFEQLPPELQQGLLQAIASGQVNIEQIPGAARQQIEAAMAKARGDQPANSPAKTLNTAANGGAAGGQTGQLRGLVDAYQGR